MSTINEIKIQIKSLLGFNELSDTEFTKGFCNNVLLNRLPSDGNSFVKATALRGYNGKAYWEYALVIANSLKSASNTAQDVSTEISKELLKNDDYELEVIQTDAFELISKSRDLGWLVFGLTDELTPQTMIEQFNKLDKAYQSLKNQIDAVRNSLDSGHDPDRHLFNY
ncbi:MAG: hypothetical protein PUP90_08785 [Nostoc sp. S4]|nr:hypothetical protein [Nostoc sp. S4]